MTVGDLCFFSESNCKTPGIVGIMEVVGEARPDPIQFDPDSPYYDPKSSKDKPKWNCVMVEFRRKFNKVPITSLREHANRDTDPLNGMQLFRQTRLSVSKVEDDEWEFIMKLIEESESSDGSAGPSPKKSRKSAASETAESLSTTPAKTPAKTPTARSSRKTAFEAEDPSVAIEAATGPTNTRSSLAGGKKSGRKSTVTFADSTPAKNDGAEDEAAPTKTPARYRKTPAKPAVIPADLAEEAEDEESATDEVEATTTEETPAPRRGRAKAATTPATEPKPASKKTPTSKDSEVKPPATEPRPRGRPAATTKSASATPVPKSAGSAKAKSTPGAKDADADTEMEDAAEEVAEETPAPRRARGKAATPASAPKASTATAKTPSARGAAVQKVPATEPRPRGRPLGSGKAASASVPEPAAEAVEDAAEATPAPKRGRPKGGATPAAPATEPKVRVSKTPAKRATAVAAPKTEPRPRGRPSAVVGGKKKEVKTPRSTTGKKAAAGKKTPAAATEEDANAEGEDTTMLDPTPSRPATLAKEATNESLGTAGPSPADALSPVRGSQEVPSSSQVVRESVNGSFTSAVGQEEKEGDVVPSSSAAFDFGAGKGQAAAAAAPAPAGLQVGDQGPQIEIQEPTELTFAAAGSANGEEQGPDVRDVTGQSSPGSAKVHSEAAEVVSPDFKMAGTEEEERVVVSTETPGPGERASTPEYSSIFGNGEGGEGGEGGRKSFLGRIGEGFMNVVTSPGRAVSRALSGTPGPERPGSKGQDAVDVDGEGGETKPLDVMMEGAEDFGGPLPGNVGEGEQGMKPLPVSVEEVHDAEL